MDQMQNLQQQSDSDDEPEEISKSVSESRAKESLRNEKLAKSAVNEKQKEKRRQILARDIEQKRIKQQQQQLNIERLPNDIFDELDFTVKGNKGQQEVDSQDHKLTNDEQQHKKRRKRKKNEAKILETSSTKYKVLSMDEINNCKVPISQTMAVNFRERMLYDKRRNKRILSREAFGNRLKRQAFRK